MARRVAKTSVAVGLVAGLVAGLAPRPGHAQTAIVLEVHEGARPDYADRYLEPVIESLQEHGVLAGDQLARAFTAKSSQPGIAVDPDLLARLPALADEGFRAWTDARFAEAVALLEQVTRTARDAPAALLGDTLRSAYRLALVGLTLAHKRLNHRPQAADTMAELVRSFSDLPLHPNEFGSEASRVYDDARSSLARLGTGSLSVQVDDPDAIVFVNERYCATPELVAGLVPGTYRVVARKRKTTGRAYRALVEPGQNSTLHIAWAFDQAVRTAQPWTGLWFPDAAARERWLADYAIQFAEATGARTVITVGIGIDKDKGRRAVIANLFLVSKRGRQPRTISLPIEPPPDRDQLVHLAHYLIGATTIPPTDQPSTDQPGQDEPSRDQPSKDQTGKDQLRKDEPSDRGVAQPSPWRRPLLIGGLVGGLVAIGTGVYLVRIDGEGTCDSPDLRCRYVHRSAPSGYGFIAAGSLAVAGSAYFLWRGPHSSASRSASAPRSALRLAFRLAPFAIALAGEF